MRRIVIPAVAPALVLALVLLAGCGAGDPPVEEKATPEELERRLQEGDPLELGPVIIGDGENVTEFGLAASGTGLTIPEDFPVDIPILPESRVTILHRRGGKIMLGYTVPMPHVAAAKALQTDLRADDWWIEGAREDNGVTIFTAVNAKDQERTAQFSVGESDKGKGALVVVTADPVPVE